MSELKGRIKFFLVNCAHNSDLEAVRGRDLYWTFGRMVTYVCQLYPKNKAMVKREALRLVGTQQIIFDPSSLPIAQRIVKVGKVIFEEAKPVTKLANEAAKEIYANLSDRRGIKQELEQMDADVKEELINNLAVIIDNTLLKASGETYKARWRAENG